MANLFQRWAQRRFLGTDEEGMDRLVRQAGAAMGSMIFPDLHDPSTRESRTEMDPRAYYGKNPYLYRATRRVSDSIAMLPFRVMVEGGDEPREEDGELQRIFDRPNDYQGGFQFRRNLAAWLELTGDAFLFVESKGGRPRTLHILDPSAVKVVPDPRQRISHYTHIVSGKEIRIERDDMIHIAEFSATNSLRGTGCGEALRTVLELDHYSNLYNVQGFKSGGAFGRLILESDQMLTPGLLDRVKTEFKRKFFGVKHAHDPIWTVKGFKARMLASGNRDMEYVEQRKVNREEIAAATGVPPALLGVLEYANYANMDAQERIFWQAQVLPMLMLIESELTRLAKRVDARFFMKFDTSAVKALQANVLEWATLVRSLIDGRVITPNEARIILAERGLPDIAEPYEGGDDILAPIALAPIADVVSGTAIPPSSVGFGIQEGAEAKADKQLLREATMLATKRIHRARLEGIAASLIPEIEAVYSAFAEDVIRLLRREGKAEKLFAYQVDDLLVEGKKRAEALARTAARKFHGRVLTARASQLFHELDQDQVLDLSVAYVQEFINKKTHVFSRQLVGDTDAAARKRLRETLTEGAEKGETINQLQDRVRAAMDTLGPRSLVIARTEATSAFNFATLATAKQTDVAQGTQWLTALDENVRETHAAQEGIVVPLGEPFPNRLLYPGDPGGEAGEIINCRCTTTVVVGGEE